MSVLFYTVLGCWVLGFTCFLTCVLPYDSPTGATDNITTPGAARPSFEGRRDDEFLREEVTIDDDDDVDLDDPKYQQKPDWMQDAVWEAIKNQGKDHISGLEYISCVLPAVTSLSLLHILYLPSPGSRFRV